MSVSLFGGNQNIELKWWTFPGGERNVKIMEPNVIRRFHSFTVRLDFKGSDDLIDMMLLVNAARNVYPFVSLRLCIPYFPAARQDRVMTSGEPFALQVMANLIKSCNFFEVEVWDPHSDVLAGMFEPGVLKVYPQCERAADKFGDQLKRYDNATLLSPDAGALKKIYKLAKLLDMPVVEAGKVRDVNTGEIVKTTVDANVMLYDTVVIVDDICDGGRTFIELAKVIKEMKPNVKLVLYVTHGIFSKGRGPLLEYFDELLVYNEMDK